MAHLWSQSEAQGWALVPLDEVVGHTLLFTGDRSAPLRRVETLGDLPRHPVCLRSFGPSGDSWALLTRPGRPGVLVNGYPVASGIRVLHDRDCVVIDATHWFHLSTERQARVVPFPGADREIRCARCHQPLVPGTSAVRCPGASCGYWHHEDAEHETACWSGFNTCAVCGQPTAATGLAWEPEQARGELQ